MTLSSDPPPPPPEQQQIGTATPYSQQQERKDASSNTTRKFDVRRVAVIGAGPAGLAAAKYLQAEGVFETIDIFEQRDQVGGVWYYTPHVDGRDAAKGVPRTSPFVGVDEPLIVGEDPSFSTPSSDSSVATSSATSSASTLTSSGATPEGNSSSSSSSGGADSGIRIPASKRQKTEDAAMMTTAGQDDGADEEKNKQQGPLFSSPMYQELNTNIPHTLMQFSDKPFPEGCEIYPTRQVVQEYLVEYADDIRGLIKFSTQVVDISLAPEGEGGGDGGEEKEQWKVTTRDLLLSSSSSSFNQDQDDTQSSIYDAVVVASGHYATPFIPDIPGIMEFDARYPDVISHSKFYRAAGDPRYDCTGSGRKVIVVGNSASGLDIAGQIRGSASSSASSSSSSTTTTSSSSSQHDGEAAGEARGENATRGPKVIMSVQTPTPEDMRQFIASQGHVYDEASPIARFLVEEKGVEFTDGRREIGVDRVLFATGYLFTYPFLKSLTGTAAPTPSSGDAESDGDDGNEIGDGRDNSKGETMKQLITDGRRVHNLAKHFIHIDHPTLAFPGLPIKVIPFPVAEAQASVFARLWSNTLPLPSREVLEEWEREPEYETVKNDEGVEETRKKKAGAYHVLPKGGDGKYINGLHDWVVKESVKKSGEKNDGRVKSKEPPFWNKRRLWERTIFAQARLAFLRSGKTAKSLEEMGFVWDGDEE